MQENRGGITSAGCRHEARLLGEMEDDVGDGGILIWYELDQFSDLSSIDGKIFAGIERNFREATQEVNCVLAVREQAMEASSLHREFVHTVALTSGWETAPATNGASAAPSIAIQFDVTHDGLLLVFWGEGAECKVIDAAGDFPWLIVMRLDTHEDIERATEDSHSVTKPSPSGSTQLGSGAGLGELWRTS